MPSSDASESWGVVFDSLQRRPLVGATVLMQDRTVSTDRRGSFVFDCVAVGSHQIIFFHPTLDSSGFGGFPSTVTVELSLRRATVLTATRIAAKIPFGEDREGFERRRRGTYGGRYISGAGLTGVNSFAGVFGQVPVEIV